MGHGDTQFAGQLSELAHLGNLIFGDPVANKGHLVQRGAAAFGDALVIFAGKDAGGERAPHREADAQVCCDGSEFAFHAVAVEHVVLGLLHCGWN